MLRFATLIAALLMSAALVALGTYSFHRETARSRPVVLPFEVFWCSEDGDCAVTDRIGCCSCAQGGAQAAITAWRRDELRRFLKNACAPEHICVQVDLCRKDVKARCIERRCQLVVGGEQ
jgi:hypothetical protein